VKYLVALAALLLAGCTATIGKTQPAPTPQVIYVRDEAAIAEAKVDGATQAILVSAVVGVGTVVLGSLAYAATHTRHEQPRQPAQLPTRVTYVTHNHLHIHSAGPGRESVQKMLDEVAR
jgi:hypothetical protein